MAKKEKPAPTRLTQWGRLAIISEARVPHTFKRGGETENVSPAIVKSVLRELGTWDDPGRLVFNSVERIAFDTQIPEASVYKALRVLREHGWQKRRPRGMGMSKQTLLDWEMIEASRVPFVPKKAEPEKAVNEDEPDSQVNTEEDEFDFGKATRADVIEALRELDHIGKKLTGKDAESIARGLADQFGDDGALLAVQSVTERSLEYAARPNVRSVAGYLRERINEDWKTSIEASIREALQTACTEEVPIPFKQACSDKLVAYWVSLLQEFSADEYLVSDLRIDANGRFVTVHRASPDFADTTAEALEYAPES